MFVKGISPFVGSRSLMPNKRGVKEEGDLKRAVERAKKAAAHHEAARSALRAAVIDARRAGMTLESIGGILGVTRQRVRQIVREAGLR